tara:strand:- start:18 stop:1094 length:1077 start_codon:yes stop_codon:yes gene_type:complete
MWQYVGALTGWSRTQCFSMELVEEAAASFASGGGVLVACGVNLWLSHPHKANRELAEFLEILATNESLFEDLHPSPFVAIPFVLPVRAYEMLERMRFRSEPLVLGDRPHDVIGQFKQDLTDRPGELEAPLSEGGYIVRTPPQQSCRRGAFSTMLANHLPTSVIEERVLSDPAALAKYPVLFLPNVGHLTREEVEGITEYVKLGGRLLATYRTSLYGAESEEIRDNFALADLLGVDRVDPNPTNSLITNNTSGPLGRSTRTAAAFRVNGWPRGAPMSCGRSIGSSSSKRGREPMWWRTSYSAGARTMLCVPPSPAVRSARDASSIWPRRWRSFISNIACWWSAIFWAPWWIGSTRRAGL